MSFTAVSCTLDSGSGVGHVQLARPKSSNAMNRDMWTELPLVREQVIQTYFFFWPQRRLGQLTCPPYRRRRRSRTLSSRVPV